MPQPHTHTHTHTFAIMSHAAIRNNRSTRDEIGHASCSAYEVGSGGEMRPDDTVPEFQQTISVPFPSPWQVFDPQHRTKPPDFQIALPRKKCSPHQRDSEWLASIRPTLSRCQSPSPRPLNVSGLVLGSISKKILGA